jgi:hypothetical protein
LREELRKQRSFLAVALRGEIRGDIEMGLADIDTDIG